MAADLGVLFKKMKAEGLQVDNLLVSPYLRCMQTAYPLAFEIGCPMKIEPGLKEFPGAHIAGHPEWEEAGLLDARQRAHLFPLLVDSEYGEMEQLYSGDVEETTAELYFERILLFAQSYLARHTVSRGRPETNVFVSHNFNLVVFISLMCGVGFKEAFGMAGMNNTDCHIMIERESSHSPCELLPELI
jgi:broad specificity phosphatase PhoE